MTAKSLPGGLNYRGGPTKPKIINKIQSMWEGDMC